MIYIVPHPLTRPAEKQMDLLYASLDLHGVEYVITSTITDIPKNSTVITDCFVMETAYGDPGHDIATQILDHCGTCKIIFYYPSESYATLSASFIPTAKILTDRNIEGHLIKCGDWDIDGFTTNHNLPEFFAWILNSEFNRARLSYTYDMIDTSPKEKKFLFFNGESRQPREYLFGLYRDAGLLDNSMYSHRGGKGDTGIAPSADWKDPFIHPDFRFYAYLPSHYYKTDVSIVSETTQMEFFPTEKIFKSLMLGHPFILFGGRHSLRKLRDLGFKTFGSVIDESYDDVEFPLGRADKLIDVFKTCPDDVTSKTVAERQHNRAHFFTIANGIYGRIIKILCDVDKTIVINESFDVSSDMLRKYFLN